MMIFTSLSSNLKSMKTRGLNNPQSKHISWYMIVSERNANRFCIDTRICDLTEGPSHHHIEQLGNFFATQVRHVKLVEMQ